MPKKKNDPNIEALRKQYVAKRNDLIQQSRKSLSMIENKAVSYVISKVKPGDSKDTVYKFDCAEFYTLIQWKKQNYTNLRALLYSIASQTVGIIDDDGTEKIVHWFNTIHLKKDGRGRIVSDSKLPSQYIEIKLHEDILEYLFDLDEQKRVSGAHYTTYQLQNISLMKHIYSQNLYELLKSYENVGKWTFEYGTGSPRDIQLLIANYEPIKQEKKSSGIPEMRPVIPKSWSSFTFFERDVLKPGKEEINKYTDIIIDYKGLKKDLHGVSHRKYCAVFFNISTKTEIEAQQTNSIIDAEYQDMADARNFHQVTLEDLEAELSINQIVDRRKEKIAKDRELLKQEKQADVIDQAKYPVALSLFNPFFSENEINSLVDAAIEQIANNHLDVNWKMREMWAVDYIDHYNKMVQATASDTMTTTYRRLLDMIRKDYDQFAGLITGYEKIEEPVIDIEETVPVMSGDNKSDNEEEITLGSLLESLHEGNNSDTDNDDDAENENDKSDTSEMLGEDNELDTDITEDNNLDTDDDELSVAEIQKQIEVLQNKLRQKKRTVKKNG